ncbi:alpha/beta hydrolase family protein [Kineococcus gynurae]|uniref:Alpha/beta hydrolase family protein n=1 Tax=Kineococcus gynurae TaxID=452979 RepID=A0ABV5LTL9_9ACTN
MRPPLPRPRVPRRTLLALGAGAPLALAACSSGGDAGRAGTPAPTARYRPTEMDPLTAVPTGLDAGQCRTYRYGEHPRQVSDLWLPEDPRDGLVVAVHGGGYNDTTTRNDVVSWVADLVSNRWPVLNVDYRGAGDAGWPGTFEDVATAVDIAVDAAIEQGVNATNSMIVGHSAGGHLAMWAAARHRLPAGAPGADPRWRPRCAASFSGVLHPSELGDLDTGDSNVIAVFGGTTAQVDDRYAVGDPTRLVPLGMPLLACHGTADRVVSDQQSVQFAEAARGAGDDVELRLVEGADHGQPLNTGSPMFQIGVQFLVAQLGD